MAFSRGDRVEVCSNEEGFVGSYYEGRIVAEFKGGAYGVRYKNLLKDDESGPLTEIVAVNEVRPVPPPIPATGFFRLDRVDAFDNDGWWAGIITGAKKSKPEWYYVYFESSGDEIAYPVSRIRVHLDWVKGKWLSAFARN